jgi:hypothetical protein
MWWLVEGRENVVVVVTRWRVLFFISAVVVMSVRLGGFCTLVFVSASLSCIN